MQHMFVASDLPRTLPIFPLPGALLLPRARLPLHIFEPRYLSMLDDALKTTDRLIGMIQPREGKTTGKSSLHAIGCAGRVTGFSETEDGRYMITLAGISRFRVVKEVEGFHPYRRCAVNWDSFERDLGPSEHDKGFDRDAFFEALKQFFESEELKTDWESLKEADDELLAVIGEEERLMPHLHLSLQAGDNMVLKRMKRRHSREDAIAFCEEVRRRRPDAADWP